MQEKEGGISNETKRKIDGRIGPKMGLFKPRAPGRYSSRNQGLFQIGRVVREVNSYLSQFRVHWGSESNNQWSRNDDTKRAARNYCIGLLLPGRRKNMTGVANRLNVDNNVVQQFISDSPWDYKSVVLTNMMAMSDLLSTKDGVFVVDDTGQAKKGNQSPGVARQYSGTLGKTDNCQIIVSTDYAISGVARNADAIYWPMLMELYLPEKWFKDPIRCEKAGIPSDITFRKKPQIALEHIKALIKAKVPHRATIADAGYGTDGDFRMELRALEEPYALAVRLSHISVVDEKTPILPPGQKRAKGRPTEYITLPKGIKPKTAKRISEEIQEEEWKTVEWNEGTKGTLKADFVRRRVRVCSNGRPTDETGWLLMERTIENEIKAHICWRLDDYSLEDLSKLVHLRWTVEQCFEQMQGEVGLTDFEGRKWQGWHHHAVMVILAFCFLVLLRILESDELGPLPTLPQIRREFLRIYTQRFLEIRLKISPEEAESVLEDLPFLVPE